MGSQSRKPRKRPWITALKVVCWVVAILGVLTGIFFICLSSYLRPAHITELIKKEAGKYLNANLELGSVDYKIFSTYPWMWIEIDSLSIVSKSLDGLPSEVRDSLPQNADFLASVDKFSGRVNIHSLLHGNVNLKDIEITKPSVNIVIANDSVSNFNIMKEVPHIKKVPDVDISEIKVISPLSLSFFSLPFDMEGRMGVESFYFTRNEDNVYSVGFDGNLFGRWQDYSLPGNVPLKFNAGIKPDLTNLALRLKDMSVSVAGMALDANGEILLGKKGLEIEKANLAFRIEDLFALPQYLPSQLSEKILLPEWITGYLPFEATLSVLSDFKIALTAPFSFSLDMLPEMEAAVRVEDANLLAEPPGEKRLHAHDIYMEMVLDYNPQSPSATSLKLNELRLKGEGVALNVKGELENILEETQNFSGEADFSTPLMRSLSELWPSAPAKIAGYLKGKVNFSGRLDNYGKNGVSDMKFSGSLYSHTLNVNQKKTGNLKMKNMETDFKISVPCYPLNNYKGLGMAVSFTADNVLGEMNDAEFRAGDLIFDLDVLDTVSGTPVPYGNLLLSAKNIGAKLPDTDFTGASLDIKAKGSLKSGSGSPGLAPVNGTTGGDDALLASRINHTPLVLEYEGGGILQTLMSLLNLDLNVKLRDGSLKTGLYLYPIEFSSLGLSTNLEDLSFETQDLQIAHTGVSMDGNVSDLGTFLTSYSATPLKMNADIRFNNVDINQLSWGYYGALIQKGMNRDSVFFNAPVTPYTAADSVCVAIPRNLEANLRLQAKSANYMQFNFSPLSTTILVNKGAATLKDLTIGTPYCTAVVDWTYSTSNLADIFMDLNARVKDFRFDAFYKTIPAVVEKSQELTNLTGQIDALIHCRFGMFPNMFMDSQSLAGKFDVKAYGMKFARTGKIEKITHLLLIDGDEPINIDNMNITGGYHDNILQLNPFKIGFDEYVIGVAGVNNFGGEMFYHVALEKSPFHLPFGVSITGNMKHPEIQLGGTRINNAETEKILEFRKKNIDLNIMTWLHHGWNLFIKEAAKYEGGLEKNK